MEPFEIPSYIDIPAHSTPLGLAFFPENGWPKEYQLKLLVAYHGSWNRKVPTGYKIVIYVLDREGKYLGEEDFITGWLQGNEAIGRPVDILIKENGVIYISDDKAGIIYRVIYEGKKETKTQEKLKKHLAH
jgi:glucose/arabinose dehydrogenase